MSATNKQASALPAPEQAYGHLFDNVHAQVFFGTLARRGYSPQTEKEAQDLLELAGALRKVPQEEKTANDSRFGDALQALNGYLGQTAQGQQAAAQQADYAIKQAAANLMADPATYNSVLSLMQYAAQQQTQQA